MLNPWGKRNCRNWGWISSRFSMVFTCQMPSQKGGTNNNPCRLRLVVPWKKPPKNTAAKKRQPQRAWAIACKSTRQALPTQPRLKKKLHAYMLPCLTCGGLGWGGGVITFLETFFSLMAISFCCCLFDILMGKMLKSFKIQHCRVETHAIWGGQTWTGSWTISLFEH